MFRREIGRGNMCEERGEGGEGVYIIYTILQYVLRRKLTQED